MDDGTLRALLAAEFSGAISPTDASTKSQGGAVAMDYYLGDMTRDMPAPAGRSSAVSMDVSDTIEGIMPPLMEIFNSGDEVVRFEPVGPEDVEAAKQETDYINHVFMKENPGFLVLYQFFKDALLQKVGIVKVWSEKEDKEERETYYDKTDDEFALIVSAPDVEVVEHTVHSGDESDKGGDSSEQYENDEPATGVPAAPVSQLAPKLHDVTVVTKKSKIKHRVMGVPPEEFGFRRDTRRLPDANYCYHKTPRSVEELISLGYDAQQIKSLPTFRGWSGPEETSRDTMDEGGSTGVSDVNEASRMVEIVEHYIRMDYKGDNKPCLYRVTTGGAGGESKILNRDGKPDVIEFDLIPFAAISPVIQPHRLIGRSVADLVMDVQRIKTALLRQMLDNQYLANNPRVEVAESMASDNTLDDLLVSRPGGIVRTKQPGGVNWQQVPNISATIYPALEYMDGVKEWRTGVVKQSLGIDSDSLQYQSATAVSHSYTAAQAKTRLIARIFAEGVKDIFGLLHGTIKKHADKPQIVRLRNQWVSVDPRNWITRNDITINVGLGTGSKAERQNQLMAIMNVQKEFLLGGKTNLVSDMDLYNSAKELTRLAGKQDTETFFTDPSTQPPPQPQPDPKLQIEMMKLQTQDKKTQADLAHQQWKMQADAALEQQKFEHDKELSLIKARLDMQEVAHKQQMAERKAQVDEHVAMRKVEIDGVKAHHQIATKQAETDATIAEASKPDPMTEIIARMDAQQHRHEEHMHALVKHVTAPKRIVRGKDGRPSHIETVVQ